jgi:hypothetical protein
MNSNVTDPEWRLNGVTRFVAASDGAEPNREHLRAQTHIVRTARYKPEQDLDAATA